MRPSNLMTMAYTTKDVREGCYEITTGGKMTVIQPKWSDMTF